MKNIFPPWKHVTYEGFQMQYLAVLMAFILPLLVNAAPVGENHDAGKAAALTYLCMHENYALDAFYMKCFEDGMHECDALNALADKDLIL